MRLDFDFKSQAQTRNGKLASLSEDTEDMLTLQTY